MGRSLWTGVFLAALCACGDGGDSDAGDSDSDSGDSDAGDRDSDAGNDDSGGGDSGNRQDAGDGGDSLVTYGELYEGGLFHLGPVDWQESEWHNACAPAGGYAPSISALEGTLLGGLWIGVPDVSRYCDACIHVETAAGKSAVLRVVTTTETTPNSIDVSPEAFEVLDSGEHPRAMSWQLARCPDTGDIVYEFQVGAQQWWSSLWVRNARVPIESVEVRSANHASFVPLTRGPDGALTDWDGFGVGPFTLRVTSIEGAVIEDDFAWPEGGIDGLTVTGSGNFQ
jgi:expansin (peptidoglycan-binding protein)